MHEAREVIESGSSTLPSSPVSGDHADDEDVDDGHLLQTKDDVDVDEIDPLPPFILDQVKVAMERVYKFVFIHKPYFNKLVVAPSVIMLMM
jgi:hypothetical protein